MHFFPFFLSSLIKRRALRQPKSLFSPSSPSSPVLPISAYSFVHRQNTLIMYLKNLAGQLLASSALWSLVAATPRANLESRHDHSPIKPKVFLIDMVSFRNSRTMCEESAHTLSNSSHQKGQSGTGSQNSTCSPKTSPCLASPPSFQTRIALPITMSVRS